MLMIIALRELCLLLGSVQVALVVENIGARHVGRDELEYDVELEFALDALERKVGLLDCLIALFINKVVVVRYATPEIIAFEDV